MRRRVTFTSSAFPKAPGEDEETVNAACWGKRLLEWVRDRLPEHGVETGENLCEDWGWLVALKNEGFPLWIGGGAIVDEEDGDGTEGPVAFGLFVAAEPGLFARLFRRVDPKPAVERAQAALQRLIESSDQIHDVHWES